MMKAKKILLVGILVIASVLRLWKINDVPVSLFGDELDVGYQAYSILKTGKDYYGNFLPIHFHSIAEWRTPLYLYSAVPSVALFGISPLGVRLPAAIFGILGVLALYLLVRELFDNENLALFSAAVLTFSPWHIQYSRAGFEVTELLFFLFIGLYFFFKGIKDGKWLWLSMVVLALTPWIYSTAKFFTPVLVIFLFLIWGRKLLALSKKYLVYAVLALIIVGAPIFLDTVFGGGAQRFGYISVFTDPTTEPEVGAARGVDAKARGETGTGLSPTLLDRIIHNKFTYWGTNFLHNYYQPFSSDFLFNQGDPNPRHSIHGMGELYKVEILPLIIGMILFFSLSGYGLKVKSLILFLILAGVLPAALTRDGGNHATRLIFILPPLVFLIAYGLYRGVNLFGARFKYLLSGIYLLLFAINLLFYEHNYWVHNPTYSERWWHAGFADSIQSIKAIDGNYDRVIISTAGEPPWIFFAGWYQYPPDKWQKEFPLGNDVNVSGFGKISHTDKFYFGSPDSGVSIYEIGKYINTKTLYLAVAKEVGANLIMEPERTPPDLYLIKAIPYPSGEPAFYLFSGKNK
jgi:4-amino-4-deoxy-L-arabinose transferase-like glycosyltransferase